MNINRSKTIGALSLVVPFSYSFFYVFMMLLNHEVTNGLLRLFCGTLCVFTFLLLGISFSRYVRKYEMSLYFLFAILVFLIFFTRFFYSKNNSQYNGAFLSFCVRGLPSMMLAIHLCKDRKSYYYFLRLSRPFVIVYTIATFIASFNRRSSILEYQSISYYAVFAFGITAFLLLHSDDMDRMGISLFKGKYWDFVYITMMLIQVFSMLSGGGRGAFVLLIVYVLYLLLSIIFNPHKAFTVVGGLLFILLLISLFGLVNRLDLSSFFDGYNRIRSFFTNLDLANDQRSHIYNTAIDIYKEKPIFGGGIGSVYYRLGSYSHNLFLDVLIDTGIVGLVIVMLVLFSFLRKARMVLKSSWEYQLPVLMFVGSFVFLMFSSNILIDGCLWFGLVFVFFKARLLIDEKNMLYSS